jgi:hypothetical protein
MGFRRTDRLSDLIKLKALILVTCSACGHQALFNPADVLQYFGVDKEVSALPLCCGSGSVLAAPDPRACWTGATSRISQSLYGKFSVQN